MRISGITIPDAKKLEFGLTEITGIRDATPVPHNGPKAKKPRRV